MGKLSVAVTHLNTPYGKIITEDDLAKVLRAGTLKVDCISEGSGSIIASLFVECTPELILMSMNEVGATIKSVNNLYKETLEDHMPRALEWERVHNFAEERHETGDELVAVLRQEARTIQLYNAIYRDVDSVHDLSNPMLSRFVRACIDHGGRVPDGTDRNTLLRECPEILEATEGAYRKYIQ